MLQITGAETTEAEELTAFAPAISRSPIAPDNTSNTKATTVRHLDIDPPDGKLTRREYRYFCSLMEQNCYHVSKRSTLLDNVPLNGTRRSGRGNSIRIVQDKSRIQDRRGQRYISTT
jgi:hypothetical protein